MKDGTKRRSNGARQNRPLGCIPERDRSLEAGFQKQTPLEPENWGEIVFEGIEDGNTSGMWLLSYQDLITMPEGVKKLPVAVFKHKEDALKMAALLDKLSEIEKFWHLDTVFLQPDDVQKLAADIWGYDNSKPLLKIARES